MSRGPAASGRRFERVADDSKHSRGADRSRSARDRLHADPATPTPSRVRDLATPYRTIWAAPQARAVRPLWFESGGRDRGQRPRPAASSPPRKQAPRRRQGRPRPERECRPFAPARRRCPVEKAIQGHPRPHAEGVSGVRPRGLEMCLGQADSTPMAVLRNRGGRPAARGSRPPRAMIARVRAGAPRRMRAIAQSSPGQRASSSLKRRNAPRPLIAMARRSARPGSSTDAMNRSMSR
jgi:hypothetical protein